MKRLLLLSFILFATASYAQNRYWQQQVNFTITVALNDTDHSLQAFETIEYINHSPDTLHYIWFHVWPNAYKNERTAFAEQLLKNGRTDFYFSPPEDKGYITQLDFKVNGSAATYESDKRHIDVIKLVLPSALTPGDKVIITTPFHVKLPKYFSRSGHVANDYQVTQWFPKPAVYDKEGWHPMAYLDQGEFYSEFGNFNVSITAPSAYVIAATGILHDKETLLQLIEKGKHVVSGTSKTWRYTQSNIHDFAWFASKDFTVKHDTAMLASQKVVDVFSFHRDNNKTWDKSIAYVKDGLRNYSRWIGDYPYTVASVVEGVYNLTSGGMEYPTISYITTPEAGKELDLTIIHEVGHNWFYGALATNERTHPWMDEGMNTFYQNRYAETKYPLPPDKRKKAITLMNSTEDEEALLFNSYVKARKDQPMATSSENFSWVNYDLMIYHKAPLWLKQMEQQLGRDIFDSSMRHYYTQWKFKHPTPEDFKTSMQQVSRVNLNNLFDKLGSTGPLTTPKSKKANLSFIFNLDETDKYNHISVSPLAGFNNYDKAMLGGFIHNYQLPLNNFRFIAGALYGSGSKKINPLGRASFNVYKPGYDFEASASFISFTQNDFLPANGSKLYLRMKRIVPALKLTSFDKDATVTRRSVFQWKSFFISEDALKFTTTYTPVDTIEHVSAVTNNSLINRLSISMSDDRVLHPYHVNFSTDQGGKFLRTALTAKYFFNYADGVSGLSARVFAGKFFYLVPKTTNSRVKNDRYFITMTGPKGYEDYTYRDYFIGRNESGNWKSQQLMERDGFFKVHADLPANKIGKTDDWLTSINIVSDIPEAINPLRALPFRSPLKLFADVGTYAQAWKDNPPGGRFVFDAGIQLSVLRSILNVYIPVLYSKVYRDYYKSTITKNRFMKTISFNVDLSQLQPKKLLPVFPL